MKPSNNPTKLPPLEQWPIWMQLAAKDIGVRELPGVAVHPRIATYYTHAHDLSLHNVRSANDSDVAWCAAAVSCWLDESGYVSANTARARRYLGWGETLDTPRFGCLVVLKRGDPSSGKGHVAFYLEPASDAKLWLLGGNQGNSVRYSNTYSVADVLGYRWPRESDLLT